MYKKKILRIIIKSLEDIHKSFSYFLIRLFEKLNIEHNIIYLPKKSTKFTLLKSPHVDKKAREQFELIKLKTIIDIKFSNYRKKIIEFLLLNKPKFIKISLKKLNF
jgi:small subunit ribosomal protein S10